MEPAGPPAADVGGSNHPQKRIRKDGLGGRPSSTLYSGLGFAAPITNNKNILALRRARALIAPSVILTMGTDGISRFVSNGGNTRDVVGGAAVVVPTQLPAGPPAADVIPTLPPVEPPALPVVVGIR